MGEREQGKPVERNLTVYYLCAENSQQWMNSYVSFLSFSKIGVACMCVGVCVHVCVCVCLCVGGVFMGSSGGVGITASTPLFFTKQ